MVGENGREPLIGALKELPEEIGSFSQFEKMASKVLPHVPASELKALYRALKERRSCKTVALPPVFVKNGILAAGFDGINFRIMGAAINEDDVLYRNEAREFADAAWRGDLKDRPFAEAAVVYLQDPATLAVEGAVYIGLNRPLEEIWADKSKPMSELFNEAIIEVTGDRLLLREMAAVTGHYVSPMFHCVNCGCPLADNISCDGCKNKFRYDPGDILWEKESLGCALPAVLEAYFESGHQEGFFSIAPFLQRIKERDKWLENAKQAEE